VVTLREVDVPARPLSVLRSVIGEERSDHLESVAARTRATLDGKVVWNVNSTASGGGVAEMLQVLVGYTRAAGIDARWLVIEGDPRFFAITKRLHNRIHGVQGDSGPLGPAEAAHYADVTAANATAMLDRVRSGDIVILHDPQTAGMAPQLAAAGARIIWRCHIGADMQNSWTEEAWGFLRPFLDGCDAFVFSRLAYVPSWVPAERVAVIAPSIDPFSPKNQAIPAVQLPRFLARIGLLSRYPDGPAVFTRRDGTPGEVVHRATIVSDGVPLDSPGDLVVQVSRWDRLKDMSGVMVGFASGVVGRNDAHLALVGPSVDGVTDDPEGAEVLAECVTTWEALPSAARRRISLVSLAMVDIDENAAMVNAVQRAATVIVQKSLAEGFGLTVAEGMWKGKPMVASGVGGIIDQVVPGTGILLDDPTDLEAYADALVGLLTRPAEVARLGDNARRHVLDVFVGDRHLLQYADLIERLVSGPPSPGDAGPVR
jgi:trehalose synthase